MSRKGRKLRLRKPSDGPLKVDILSIANKFSGQGVGSAFEEQSNLMRSLPENEFSVRINSFSGADVIHCHSVEPMNYLRMKLTREVSVVHCHFLPETLRGSIHLPGPMLEIYCKYVIEFYRAADWIVVVNPIFIPKLEAYGIPKDHIRYIPNYVSEELFYPQDAETIRRKREELGAAEGQQLVLSVGQVQTRKGVLDFVSLAEKMPKTRFVWCGGFSFGAMTDGYEELKRVTEHPPENVLFTGIVPREQMNDYFNAADVLFMPSYQELFPMCILEAASVGKPLLLRNLDLYPDILFGNYASGETLEDFRRELDRLGSDRAYYEQMKCRSHAIHEFYSPGNIREQWSEFYKTVYNETTGKNDQKMMKE